MTKILFVIPSMSGAGGSEKLVDSLSRLLSDGYTVSIATFDNVNTQPFFASEIPFYPLGKCLELPLPLRVFTYLCLAHRLCLLKRNLQIDLTISVLWRADLVNALARSRDKLFSLLVINLAGNKANALMVKFRFLVGMVYRRFDKVFAINPSIAEEARSLFALVSGKLGVFKNFVARPECDPIFRDNILRFVFCGRAVHEKNGDGLLHVWAAYSQRNQGRQLILIGDGPLFNQWKNLAAELGMRIGTAPQDLEAQVLFLGAVKNPESLMIGARGLLLTSRHEGVPTVAILAATLELPVFGADCQGGGMRYLFGNYADADFGPPISSGLKLLLPVPDSTVPESIQAWLTTIEAVDADVELRNFWLKVSTAIAESHSPDAVRKEWHCEIAKVLLT